MDSTVLSTSLPQIAAAFGESPVRLSFAITAYLFSLAVFIPISGWVADRFGARTVFRAAIVVFLLGSILCGLSGSLPELVRPRAAPGPGRGHDGAGRAAGAAALGRQGRAGDRHGLADRAGADRAGDRAIARRVHHDLLSLALDLLDQRPDRGAGLGAGDDLHPRYARGATAAIGPGWVRPQLGRASSASSSASRPSAVASCRTGPPWRCSAVGVVGILLYVRHAGRVAHPVVDLSLLRIPTFRASVIGGFLFRIGIGALPFLLPLMLQAGFGLSAFGSGLLTFAAAGCATMKLAARPILRRFGFKRVLLANALFSALSLGAMRPVPARHAASLLILMVLLIGGFFRSLQFTSINTLGYADIDRAQHEPGHELLQHGAAAVLERRRRHRGAAAASHHGRPQRRACCAPATSCRRSSWSGSAPRCRRWRSCACPPDAGAEVSGHRHDAPLPASGAAQDR